MTRSFNLGDRFDYNSSPPPTVTAQLGCMMCKQNVAVACSDWDSLEALQQNAKDVAPVVEAGRTSGPSPCGMKAVEGFCKFSDGIDLCRALIEDGEIPGVKRA